MSTIRQRLLQFLHQESPPPAESPAPPQSAIMVPMTVHPQADNDEVEARIGELREATRQAGIQRDDPMMPLVTAMAHSIRFLGDRTTRSDRIAGEASQRIVDALVVGRQTADVELRRFQAGLERTESDFILRVGDSIARSADKALTRRVEVFDRNTALLAAGILFATIASCLGGGYWWGHSTALNNIVGIEDGVASTLSVEHENAVNWIWVMQWNDFKNSINYGHNCKYENGRKWCWAHIRVEDDTMSINTSGK